MKTIASRQNPLVREFRSVAHEPDTTGARVLLDGPHLIRDAMDADLTFEVVAVASSRLATTTEEGALAGALAQRGVEVVSVSDAVFPAISPVRTPSGIVAIATMRPVAAEDVCARSDACIVAPVDVQDPGNLGSLLRAAEAGGGTGALVCHSRHGSAASPFSWKAIRGSMGSAVRLPIVAGLEGTAAVDLLKGARVKTVAAVPRDGRDPDAVDWRGSVAILLGGEGGGLGPAAIAACDARVTIPMAPRVDSLNVATAGAILIYAARRQRSTA